MGNETAVGTSISGTEIVRIRTGFSFMLLCPCNVGGHSTQRTFAFCWLSVGNGLNWRRFIYRWSCQFSPHHISETVNHFYRPDDLQSRILLEL
jgi:hypothetical protein